VVPHFESIGLTKSQLHDRTRLHGDVCGRVIIDSWVIYNMRSTVDRWNGGVQSAVVVQS